MLNQNLNSFTELTQNIQMTTTIKQQSRLAYLNPIFQNKVGVFFSKDQKIITLEQENESLKSQLKKELELYNMLMKETAQSQSKLNRANNQQSLLDVEHQMLTQSVLKLERKIKQNQPTIGRLTQDIQVLTQEYSIVQQSLQLQLKKTSEDQNLIRRYKQEIRNEKLMLKSQKNITKISQTFKKSYDNYLKNLQILQNKLQGKKKYLLILTKKAEKQKQCQIQEEQAYNSKKSKIGSNYSRSKLPQNKLAASNKFIQQQQAQQGKYNMKNYNDLIRKKNAILASRK